mgnify:CR=1 FL=1
MTIQIRGAKKLSKRLKALSQGGQEISRQSVRAGCSVLAAACTAAAPGTIKREVGFSVKQVGAKIVGRAGLMRFPRRSDGQNGPHGVYLDQGTKYITARRFIAAALRAGRSAALMAIRRSAKARIRRIAAA